jgi:hypothetical protein
MILNEHRSRVGDEHLPAMARRTDSGRAMNVETDVIVSSDCSFAGMDACPHSDAGSTCPIVSLETTLEFDCRGDSILR